MQGVEMQTHGNQYDNSGINFKDEKLPATMPNPSGNSGN
jgi:hypothetical protein